MRDDNPQPIKDYHAAFAQAVVAVARQHGVGDVRMKFRRASSKVFCDAGSQWDSTEVELVWHEGRHGDGAPIELKLFAQAQASFPEHQPKEAGDGDL